MIPIINKTKMDSLPKKQAVRICQCKTLCDEFYTISPLRGETLILCHNETKEYTAELMNALGVTKKRIKADGNKGWTINQEQYLIRYIKEFGVQFGTYAHIAKEIGKTREQVKNKVYNLQKQGLLDKWEGQK